jgi:hypothetical protein
LHSTNGLDFGEFYDLVHDPGEHHAVPPERDMSALAARLQGWRSSTVEKEAPQKIDLDDEETSALQSLGYMNQ